MTHPQDLFADYVDGTLPEKERAVVDAHLQACASCRDEIELARTAVTALAALQDEPVPFGVTGPVLAEAGRSFERRRSNLWGRLQWAAGAAAAAALVVVVAVSLDLGGDGADEATGGAATGVTSAAGAEAAPAEDATMLAGPAFEQQDANYDADGVRSLAVETAQGERDRGGEADGQERLVPAAPPRVLRCLEQAQAPIDDDRNVLVRLIEAEYEGEPAYLAVFLESPGAGQPPDAVVVWVISTQGCGLLNAVQQAI